MNLLHKGYTLILEIMHAKQEEVSEQQMYLSTHDDRKQAV